MQEKMVIVHDHRLYEEVRKIAKSNRRLGFLVILMGTYICGMVLRQNDLVKEVKELKEKGE